MPWNVPSGVYRRMSARWNSSGVGVRVIIVGVRADRDQQRLAVGRECQVARPVPAAAQPPAAGDAGRDDVLGLARGLQVAVVVEEADHRVGVGDIHILGVRPCRIEGDAERLTQALRVDRSRLHRARPVRSAQDFNAVCAALSHEQVAVGGGDDLARVVQVMGEQRDLEARRCLRDDPVGPGGHLRSVVYGGGLMRGGQVGDRDMAADAGRIRRPVSERRRAGQDGAPPAPNPGGAGRRNSGHSGPPRNGGQEAMPVEGEKGTRCGHKGGGQ